MDYMKLIRDYRKLITAFGLAAAVAAMPVLAHAQGRARVAVVVGHAMPRTGLAPLIVRPAIVGVVPYRPYVRPGFTLGISYGYAYYGPYYGYGNSYGYGYPPPGYVVGGPVRAYRGVRTALPARRWRAR